MQLISSMILEHVTIIFKSYILVNIERTLDNEETDALFKSTQACDKDACLVRKCFPQYFIGQCQNGKDGRKDVRLDLILVMACHHFWIRDLQMISWYLRGLPMKSWRCWTSWFSSWVVPAWSWMPKKRCWSHNRPSHHRFWLLRTSTGAVIKVKQTESGHKWLGCMLSAAGSKNSTLDIDYHLQSASRAFFANKWIFLSRNVSIRNKLKFFDATPIACFGTGPRCIWSNLISTFDVCSDVWLELQAGFAGGIRGTKFFIFWISTCEKWLMHVTWKHSQKPSLMNNGNLLAT